MVQMKDSLNVTKKIIELFFISHMVQMKDRLKHLVRNSANILYIPHGSDERRECDVKHENLNALYIPHGSDESCYTVRLSFKVLIIFISHMVQMKGWDSQTEPEPNPTLYPTWFR